MEVTAIKSGAAAAVEAQPLYRVCWTIAVDNIDDLWAAAAARGAQLRQASPFDIEAAIGSEDRPSVVSCLAMLAQPGPMEGCRLDDYWIDSIPDLARAAASRLHNEMEG